MSEFLEEFYDSRQTLRKQEYDPRDNMGMRLGADWQPHDTILSVALRRTLQPLKALLNPQNYSFQALNRAV